MKLTTFSSLFFLFASLSSYSQTVHTRTLGGRSIQWDKDAAKFKRDTINSLIKTLNPKIILAYDVIDIIDGDTTRFYLNETPEIEDDSTITKRIWNEANDSSGRECYIFLFYDKEDNDYTLRIVYADDESGYEYYMAPLKVDIIPYSSKNISSN